MSVLQKILNQKQKEVLLLSKSLWDLNPPKNTLSFLNALKKSPSQIPPNLIAEIKKASPSKGAILPNANILEIANTYESSGASCISVLTDEKFFAGSLDDLASVSKSIKIPTLRKDFIIDERQILQARQAGASAVLLMTSVLQTTEKLKAFRLFAEKLNMDALIETQDEAEIKKAIDSGAQIIGVNARHFSDLSVDLSRVPPLLQKIPNNVVKVAESGIISHEDVQTVSPYCDAILVGSSLMESGIEGIEKKIKKFL